MNPVSKELKPGQFFYVVTPLPSDPKRKYLHSLTPRQEFEPPSVKLAPVRAMAKKFSDLQLARCYVDFLNRLPCDVQFCVAAE